MTQFNMFRRLVLVFLPITLVLSHAATASASSVSAPPEDGETSQERPSTVITESWRLPDALQSDRGVALDADANCAVTTSPAVSPGFVSPQDGEGTDGAGSSRPVTVKTSLTCPGQEDEGFWDYVISQFTAACGSGNFIIWHMSCATIGGRVVFHAHVTCLYFD